MNLEILGQNTSQAEVTHISSHGIWILANNEEMFLSYQDFPWFQAEMLNLVTKLYI